MRKTWLYISLVVLMLSLAMAGCGKKAKPDTPAGPAPATMSKPAAAKPAVAEVDRTGWPVIVAFGDSLTFGEGLNDFTKSYPSQLQAELDKQGYKYRVVNAGISGDITAGGLNRLDTVIAHKPEIVILELGANDGLRGLPLDKMKQNLAAMIERFQEQGITVVLAGMQIPPNYGPEYTETFRKTFDELAQQYKLPLIPFFLESVAAKPELNLPDGIHPTGEGYVHVTQNVFSVLQPLLKK